MRNRRLETVGFIATILVVMCHADDVLPAEGRKWAARFFGSYFTAEDVPNFFFLSGYFLALKANADGWWRNAVMKRMRTLAVPYFLWAAILFSVCLASSLLLNGRSAPILSVFNEPLFGVMDILGILVTGGPMSCGPLWYVKTLFVFVLVAPLFFAPMRRCRWLAPALAVACAIAYGFLVQTGSPHCSFFHMGFSLVGFAAFLMGAMFALHPVEAAWCGRPWVAPLALAAWALSAQVTLVASERSLAIAPYVQVANVAVAVAALQVATMSFKIEVPAALTKLTFFYVTHTFVLGNVCRHFAGLGYFAVVAAALAICISAGLASRKFFPKTFQILTGGRG